MSDTVQQIKDKLNIIDVISPYVELHKAGKNFKGKSPFAAEKTPSFYVSPDRGMYYCFSTSQGGDIFNFVQVMEGVDFKGALKILAEKAGVELVPEDPRKKTEREKQLSALEAATIFYADCLDKEKPAIEYLEKRGVLKETIAKWRIGYAPGPPNHGWRETKEFLNNKDFTDELLLKVGLIKKADSGKEPFDVFRDRIVFPLFDSGGKVVAFSGRILTPGSEAPKYVNSPETELYKKSELLYGYDRAKTGIRNLNFSLIVEGQFDVVMCHQAGYSNTVAVSGTALTLHHAQLLERLSDKVVLALDADRAGISAMKKAAQLMLGRGLDVKIAEMPLGKDPADMILENKNSFKQVIGKSVHVIEFLLHVLRREVEDDRSFKLKAREEVLPFVLLLPSRIDQEHFVSKIAEAIKTTEEAVRFELDRLREKETVKESISHVASNESKGVEKNDVNYNSATKSLIFLRSAVEILDSNIKNIIKKEVDAVVLIGGIVEPSKEDLAGVIFHLEQQFEKMPKLALQEEIISKLNHLKNNLTKGKVSEFRNKLLRIENGQEEDSLEDVLNDLQKYEKILKENPYDISMFGD